MHLKECYDSFKMLLNKLKYTNHKWTVFGDWLHNVPLLIISISSARKKDFWFLESITSRKRVDPKKISLPPFRITLGLTKQFVKALPKEGESFRYL